MGHPHFIELLKILDSDEESRKLDVKEFGYKIDFESGYNTQLRKQGLGLNFGMIKWVKE